MTIPEKITERERRILDILRRSDVPQLVLPIDLLSPGELTTLALVAEGLSNKEIGALLVLSENTIKTNVRHIMEKLDVHNRTEAAVMYLRSGRAAGGMPKGESGGTSDKAR